jgi:adenylate kinase family enzyme
VLILICGLPGSGKTKVAKELSKKAEIFYFGY